MAERAAHNGFVIGSNPIKLTMCNRTSDKAISIVYNLNFIKKHIKNKYTFFTFYHYGNLKNTKLNKYNLYKILDKSIFNNFKHFSRNLSILSLKVDKKYLSFSKNLRYNSWFYFLKVNKSIYSYLQIKSISQFNFSIICIKLNILLKVFPLTLFTKLSKECDSNT